MIEGLGLIIVAAGASTRMQGTDKIWATVGGQSVVWHAVHRLGGIAQYTVVVVHEAQKARAEDEFKSLEPMPMIVAGGIRRQDSVACGLSVLPATAKVAIHDGARPFAGPDLLFQGAELVESCDGAIPGLPLTDTIKQVDEDSGIVMTLDRSSLRAVQTPQVFRRHSLATAHSSPHASLAVATDDAALLEACGYDVRVFPGERTNFKITTEYDLRIARLLVDNRLNPPCA